MASNTGITTSSTPLAFMQKLSTSVYLFRPEPPLTTSIAEGLTPSTSAPKLIFIIGWMEARDVHLAKYVRQYQSLYPSSAILLLKSRLASVNVNSIGRLDAKAVIDPLHAILGEGDNNTASARPELLVHVFSGGGSCMLHHVYDMYTDVASSDDSPKKRIPLHTTIYDSAPAVFSYQPTYNAVMMGVPPQRWIRFLALPAAHLLVMAWWVRIRILGLSDILAVYAKSHNDINKVQETRRVYIYSDMDKIVPVVDIENHAADAEAKGFHVKREKFIGSDHVAHARKDPDRYWRVVKEIWEGDNA
ncbi:hypothetical protein NHQ30_008274 [Ciborinia camelliae]|nr:hypothetical protein NHQ30_008274 [Ciborinia camelliae]